MIVVKKKKKYFVKSLLPWLSISLGTLAFVFITINIIHQTGFSFEIDFIRATNYGGLLAGIFTFFSVILLFLIFKQNTDSNEKSAFESRFFAMIRYHRENVDECLYLTPDSKKKQYYKGKRVFIKIHLEIETLVDEIRPHFANKTPDKYYKSEMELSFDMNNAQIQKRGIDINELNLFNIAYLVVFFGVTERGLAILDKILSKKYDKQFYQPILQSCVQKPVRYSTYYRRWENNKSDWTSKYEEQEKVKPEYVKYYGGHQIRLGHYFRHLFQAVTYVNRIDLHKFRYKDRYEYVKLLRAQLSTYEQAIFFFNSLSIGRIWELDLDLDDYNEQLITKYNLIANIPAEFITSVDLKKYYPDVVYEGIETIEKRKKIQKRYK